MNCPQINFSLKRFVCASRENWLIGRKKPFHVKYKTKNIECTYKIYKYIQPIKKMYYCRGLGSDAI